MKSIWVIGSRRFAPVSRHTLPPSIGYQDLGTETTQVQVVLAFLLRSRVPNVSGGVEMSDNYKVYAQKMSEWRAARDGGPLRGQLVELLRVVQRCEAMWALEDRIERSR